MLTMAAAVVIVRVVLILLMVTGMSCIVVGIVVLRSLNGMVAILIVPDLMFMTWEASTHMSWMHLMAMLLPRLSTVPSTVVVLEGMHRMLVLSIVAIAARIRRP